MDNKQKRILYGIILLSTYAFAEYSVANTAVLRCEGQTLFWGDKPIHLIGYSYYGLLGDRGFEPEVFLENLAAHNINFTRFFLILPWPQEPGPNLLPFAMTGEKYDLTRFNDEFFVRLRSLVKKADDLGIICQVCLFDRCGLNSGDRLAWPNNPYNAVCNVNGILQAERGGYPPFCHTKGPIAEVNSALIKKVVETIGDCRNVIYEIINEPVAQLGPLPQWHAWIARELRKNFERRTGSKVISSTGAYDDAGIDLFSMHRASTESQVQAAIRDGKALGKPVILSDDGDTSCMYNPDVTRIAVARALKLGQHFEHLEYTITLQRERDDKPSARLHQMPGLSLLTLRMLSRYSIPVLERPYASDGGIRTVNGQEVYSARIEHFDRARRIFCQRSDDNGRTWSELPVEANGGIITSSPLPGRTGVQNLVRFACLDVQSYCWPGPVTPYNAGNEWNVRLGEEIVESGLLRVGAYIPDGVLRPANRGGIPCYEADMDHKGGYAYFRLDESFPRGAVEGPVGIEVTYFDQPADSKLFLDYDGRLGPYTAAEPILLEGSGTWKSAQFTVLDGTFQGRQNNGADLRFSLRSPAAPLALWSVGIKYPKKAK